MSIKPQDIVVALKLSLGAVAQQYEKLGKELGMSASEVHAGVRRLVEARLLDPETKKVRHKDIRNFLVYGVPYAFAASPKGIARGIPTAWAASPISDKISSDGQAPPVWPSPDGKVQGVAVQPLYPSVPGAAQRDPELYHLLALVDALRMGRARERALAEKEIDQRFAHYAGA